MQEIKERLMNVLYGLQGHLEVLTPVIRQEFYCIQLRMCCEALALACLVAHGDLNTPKKMKKLWNASDLMNALLKLNPTFFPEPILVEKRESKIHHFTPNVERDFLDKKRFIRLYHSLGKDLHRGTLESMHLKTSMVDFEKIDNDVKLMCWLLETHKISLPDSKMHIVCQWGGKDQKPNVAIALPNT